MQSVQNHLKLVPSPSIKGTQNVNLNQYLTAGDFETKNYRERQAATVLDEIQALVATHPKLADI